jgi:hypothetical protein
MSPSQAGWQDPWQRSRGVSSALVRVVRSVLLGYRFPTGVLPAQIPDQRRPAAVSPVARDLELFPALKKGRPGKHLNGWA